MNKNYVIVISFVLVAVLTFSLVSAGVFDFLTGKASSDASRDRGLECARSGDCSVGEGDCRGKIDYCPVNSFCNRDIGPKYGYSRGVDVCECMEGFVSSGNGGCVEEKKSLDLVKEVFWKIEQENTAYSIALSNWSGADEWDMNKDGSISGEEVCYTSQGQSCLIALLEYDNGGTAGKGLEPFSCTQKSIIDTNPYNPVDILNVWCVNSSIH